MARLIVKSPYIKCGGGQGADGYMRYIATRERVEIIPDDRPPTRKQEQLITKLAKDFPDVKELLEYEDYVQKPTKANASSLITLALEEHWKQVQQTDGYMKYIATRPRAERLGDHDLFSDADRVDLDAAMSELEHYTGNVWTHILSLHREDAERLGYNNAQAWRALIRAHRNDIAAAMHIPPQDFRWYAAFHDEGHHPHVHMMAWSVKPGQAHLDRDGIRQMKSQLTNDIFQQELLHVYEQKAVSRDELVRETRKVMLELSRQMRELIEQLLELARTDNAESRPTVGTVDFSRLAANAVLPFEPAFFEKGLRLDVRIDRDISVSGETALLQRLMDILLDNALKYSSPGGTAWVTLQKQGNRRCRLVVKNQGERIPPEDIKNIFKRFYRVDRARSRDGSFGLGLSIAENIVVQHRGSIWAESEDGVNSFFVELPCV